MSCPGLVDLTIFSHHYRLQHDYLDSKGNILRTPKQHLLIEDDQGNRVLISAEIIKEMGNIYDRLLKNLIESN